MLLQVLALEGAGGLGKYLIRARHYTGQQLTDLRNVGQGCGGAADTKMHD